MLKQTSTQVWIRTHELSQEYWRPRILFVIASSIDTPIWIDSASNKLLFEKPFGHFIIVLGDLYLTKEFVYKLLVERVGFVFFVDMNIKRFQNFATFVCTLGIMSMNAKGKS